MHCLDPHASVDSDMVVKLAGFLESKTLKWLSR